MSNPRKPRLLFLRFTRPGLPAFIRLHLQEQIMCLSQFFDVTVINHPCDYHQLCDNYKPDIAIFESGVYVGQRDVKNVSAYPEIPKLGFIHCDAYCITREYAISDMTRWGITTCFTNSVSLGSYTPAIADNLFVWPNFVNPDLYHDYGLTKIIPVLFTGSQAIHYPWRNRINKIISQHYPSLQSPHRDVQHTAARMLSGESYARMINAAHVAPTCGTIANDVVRKHFEIPACNTCLITQRTPAIKAAGFSDLVNCVFADDIDVVEKLDWLFKNPDELERITRAGREFVESYHTLRNRDQVFQWYNHHKRLKPGQKIIQLGPFLPLTIVEQSLRNRNNHVISKGLDRILMAQGDEKLWSGNYKDAETFYIMCLNYHEMPEPKFRLALCCLYKGDPEGAIDILSIKILGVLHAGAEPDPIEWAYFIVALLCRGQLQEAVIRSNQLKVFNQELDRVRAVVRLLSHQNDVMTDRCEVRSSIHQLPKLTIAAWSENLLKMLIACRQAEIAERLARSTQLLNVVERDERNSVFDHRVRSRWLKQLFYSIIMQSLRPLWMIEKRIGYFLPYHRVRIIWLKQHFYNIIEQSLRPLWMIEKRLGYFLPYKWSAMSRDEDSLTIRRLLRSEDIRSGLLLGAAARVWLTEAFLEGMDENPNLPFVVCMNYSTSRFMKLQRRLTGKTRVRCGYISDSSLLEKENEGFGVAVIDCSELGRDIGNQNRPDADLIILDDINVGLGSVLFRTLLEDRNYILLDHEPSHRGGFAIFRKVISC